MMNWEGSSYAIDTNFVQWVDCMVRSSLAKFQTDRARIGREKGKIVDGGGCR